MKIARISPVNPGNYNLYIKNEVYSLPSPKSLPLGPFTSSLYKPLMQ